MDSYVRSTSTTWALKVIKIRRPAGGQEASTAKPSRWRGLPKRNPKAWLDVRLRYDGGGSGWVLVMARGRVVAYPADAWLLNVVLEANRADGR